MAKRDPVKEGLSRLAELESMGIGMDESASAYLRLCLKSKHGALAARAARIISSNRIAGFRLDLESVFFRCCDAPEQDPGCVAKMAVVDALNDLDYDAADLFLKGIRYVQLEPVWGKSVDTAGGLRVKCAGGLIRLNYPGVSFLLTDLLVDPQPEARMGAARALAHLGRHECELVLRLKVLQGGDEPEVIAECLSALSTFDSDETLPFLRRILHGGNRDVWPGAALALGETRSPEAVAMLSDFWSTLPRSAERFGLLLPIALTRTEEGIAFLLDVIEREAAELAIESIRALEAVGMLEASAEPVRERVGLRGDDKVTDAFRRLYDGLP
ncbi:MAG: hypothetical protein AMXMBFR84_06850 [Candidatus Hydrogenedentota bacterium]